MGGCHENAQPGNRSAGPGPVAARGRNGQARRLGTRPGRGAVERRGLPPSGPCPACRHTGTCIWAGWGKIDGDYTSVSGDFRVPVITGGQGEMAIWYGLGGINGGLVQTGVSATTVANNSPVYQAWWEVIYNDAIFGPYDLPHVIAHPVAPGDLMEASVTWQPSPGPYGTYQMFLRDVTESWSETVPASGDSAGALSHSSAEAILENVNAYDGTAPLPDFGTADLGNVRIDNSYGWVSQSPFEFTLGTGKVYISPLDGSGDFTVTWQHG